ncbi:hypothetical protein IYC_02929 [Clostridium sporogenes PA 3679]|nr:hypothetical protein IYC_02929 [Clostridium sporogenes PA 3679]
MATIMNAAVEENAVRKNIVMITMMMMIIVVATGHL